jgi:hypothetical protein
LNIELKRYNLSLPTKLFDELQLLADAENTTILELLRKFVKLGLIMYNQDCDILLRTDGKETKIIVL